MGAIKDGKRLSEKLREAREEQTPIGRGKGGIKANTGGNGKPHDSRRVSCDGPKVGGDKLARD